jgi:hypothetical protein
MDDPYGFPDPHDQLFDREIEDTLKVFDDPLANDPLSLLEYSIERTIVPPIDENIYSPSPILSELEASIEGTTVPPTFPDPHFHEPEIPEPPLYNRRLFVAPHSIQPPDPTLPGENRYWREPQLPRPHLGTAATNPKSRFRPKYQRIGKGSSKRKPNTVYCPAFKSYLSEDLCGLCSDYTPEDAPHTCKRIKRELDQFLGREEGQEDI